MITTINEYKKIMENNIISNKPNTVTLWHGGNLDNMSDDVANKSGSYEYGPGLYMTSSYNVVQKYSKGNRKLYLITVEKGVDIKDVQLKYTDILQFINKYVIGNKRKDVITRLQKFIKDDYINAEYFNNILVNLDAVKASNTVEWKRFLVNNGIDYEIVYNAFGWHEMMIVLYNTNKIINVHRFTSKDKLDEYDMRKAFN